jgi:CRP-like cAMP-binding protein
MTILRERYMVVLRDALAYLPRTGIGEYRRGAVVYDATRPPHHLYLVLSGQVHLFCTSPHGAQNLVRVVCREHFFGECTLLSPRDYDSREAAIIAETAQLMSWTLEELEQLVEREAMLGLALCQYFAIHHGMMVDRLAGMSFSSTRTRVMLSLLQLARAAGVPTPAGALRLHGLTHHLIAEYVGTSREFVTAEMNRLRTLGYVSYTRWYLDVYATGLSQCLEEQNTTVKS